MSNVEKTHARDYLDIVNRVEELRLAIENTECTDRNDLYKLIYYKRQLEFWLNEEDIEEKLKDDIQRFIEYIKGIINTIEQDKGRLKEIKSNTLKTRYEKNNILKDDRLRQFIVKIFLHRLWKIILIMLAVLVLYRLMDKTVDMAYINTAQGQMILDEGNITQEQTISDEQFSAIKNIVSTFTIIINIITLIVLGEITIKLTLDTIYVALPDQSIITENHISSELYKLVRCELETVDYCENAQYYWSELKQFADKLNSSMVTMNDEHHVKTFNKSKDKLTKQIEDIGAKIHNERYIIQVEGLADAELIHGSLFVQR